MIVFSMVITKKESILELKAAQKATRPSKISAKKINITFASTLYNYASVVVRATDQNRPTVEGIVGSNSSQGPIPFSLRFRILFFPNF